MMKTFQMTVLALTLLAVNAPGARVQEISGDTTNAGRFMSAPTILLRTHNPAKLTEFYEALGMRKVRVTPSGGAYFYLEGDLGGLEILPMHPDAQPGPPKTSRTQQGVVAIFETTDQEEVVRRARAAGSPMIEEWKATEAPIFIFYIADPENNIFGFAPRHHNVNIPTP